MKDVQVPQEHKDLRDKIENLLKEVLPSKTNIIVQNRLSIFSDSQIKIMFAVSTKEINNVREQYPQAVSLLYNIDDQELTTQIYGGAGGGSIYRQPNMDDPKEKFYAIVRIKIPFRKPKKEEQFVLKAIVRFAENWVKALKDNQEVLRYTELIDYDNFLNS